MTSQREVLLRAAMKRLRAKLVAMIKEIDEYLEIVPRPDPIDHIINPPKMVDK